MNGGEAGKKKSRWSAKLIWWVVWWWLTFVSCLLACGWRENAPHAARGCRGGPVRTSRLSCVAEVVEGAQGRGASWSQLLPLCIVPIPPHWYLKSLLLVHRLPPSLSPLLALAPSYSLLLSLFPSCPLSGRFGVSIPQRQPSRCTSD